jgi:hypothetical protein
MAYSSKYTPRPMTDIFTSDTDVNRRTCERKVPMKVLALGLGRTGTACKCLPSPLLPWTRVVEQMFAGEKKKIKKERTVS